jgi:hypothetical protein
MSLVHSDPDAQAQTIVQSHQHSIQAFLRIVLTRSNKLTIKQAQYLVQRTRVHDTWCILPTHLMQQFPKHVHKRTIRCSLTIER